MTTVGAPLGYNYYGIGPSTWEGQRTGRYTSLKSRISNIVLRVSQLFGVSKYSRLIHSVRIVEG